MTDASAERSHGSPEHFLTFRRAALRGLRRKKKKKIISCDSMSINSWGGINQVSKNRGTKINVCRVGTEFSEPQKAENPNFFFSDCT